MNVLLVVVMVIMVAGRRGEEMEDDEKIQVRGTRMWEKNEKT
jgi:hypothetical protein